MRLEAVQHLASYSSSLYTLSSSLSKKPGTSQAISLSLSKSQHFTKISRGHALRRSCSLSSDDVFRDQPSSFHAEGLANSEKEGKGHGRKKKGHCAVPKSSPFTGKHERAQDSFSHARFDFLEPMMLGIKPEFTDWLPGQETVIWANIEQKAKSLEIPLSLRMIKKKLQSEEGFSFTESKGPGYCSVKAAFASMVFIIVELQSHALHMREALCDEDLNVISSKVQKEMHSSFVWLFQQVFSRTPALMLHVMVLLADFSVYSTSHNVLLSENQIQLHPQIESSLPSSVSENCVDMKGKILNSPEAHPGFYPSDLSDSDLWDSMVDDAKKMADGVEILGSDVMRSFVSPVSVEVEPDRGYEDYLRTDLLYQMNLSREPSNPLLLCNYAQFLLLVARDHDRAEECFKRAVQVLPTDAESLSQYANFLWSVRLDLSGAEERFLQALEIEPDNSYYASRYANFLWSTGGEDTCFPINKSPNPNL